MIPRINVGKGVTGAVRYVLGEGRDPKTGELKELAPGEESRVDWIGGTGFGFEIRPKPTPSLRAAIMEFDALNQTSRTRHMRTGLRSSLARLAAGREADAASRWKRRRATRLNALGMGNAKALFVAHNDEDYAHVHIVASKINPDDRPRLRPGRQLAHAFDMGASDYEREHGGIVCTRRGDRERIARRDRRAATPAPCSRR